MAHALELAYNWRTPVTFATIGLSICLGALIRNQAAGWLPTVVILVLGWAGFLVLVWLRTRALLMVDGSRIRVRSSGAVHQVEGREVVSVGERWTPHGPSYRLVVARAGSTWRCTVPAALLRSGHATLFRWLLAEAPQAQLDAGSTRTLAELRRRGLVEEAESP